MRNFLCYLRSRWLVIGAFCLFFLLYGGAFALYRLPFAAVVYPTLLCALAGAGALVWGYIRERRTCRELEALTRSAATVIGQLPPAGDGAESAYQRLIVGLQEAAAHTAAAERERYDGMVEYYTVWAHQIKTPIAAMKLTLQNEDTPLSRTLTADLLHIEQYADMVLAFLRLGADGTDFVFRECALDDILRPTLRKLAPEFILRKLRLCYDPTDMTVLTDEKWLSFVVEQVLSNALKYTRTGSITVRAATPAALIIEDTGIGIAPEDLPRVFEKGFTGYNGRTDRTATGLGLYLCRRVCDGLGVGLSIASEPGKGTAVTLDMSRYPLKTE